MPRSARLLTFDLLGRAEAMDQMAQVEGAGTDRYHFFFFWSREVKTLPHSTGIPFSFREVFLMLFHIVSEVNCFSVVFYFHFK